MSKRYYKSEDFEGPLYNEVEFNPDTGIPYWVTPLMWEPNSKTGCKEWTEHVTIDGYIQIYVNQEHRAFRYIYLHRVIYENRFGEIPEGMDVRLSCGVKHCINSDHMSLVEHGAWIAKRKLTDQQISAIKRDPRKPQTLADIFGVSGDLIRKIKRGDRHPLVKAEITPVDKLLATLTEQAQTPQATTIPTTTNKTLGGTVECPATAIKPIAPRK